MRRWRSSGAARSRWQQRPTAHPRRWRRTCAQAKAAVGDEYATVADWLGALRPQVRATGTPESRRDLWRAILDSPVLDLLRAGDEAGARAIIEALIASINTESK
ncbi:MAG: hypothetical protein U0521_02380 [Anaerolineae bacterium]